MMSCGSMPLPSDLDMARPCSSRVQPLVAQFRYGAAPRSATPINSELWNQPRYWSPPSRYISDGQGRLFSGVRTARWLEPESNQTSRMSDSLVNSPDPHFAHDAPVGRSSAAERE